MLKNLPVREKAAKIILVLLVVFACITIFPKNFKIAVLNYDGRQSAVVLGDAKTGETKEASYIFGKGNFWVTPITKGTVKSLYIEDEKEFVDEVTAYYGSVKISKDVQISGNDGELVADITYSVGKIVLMVVLYAVLCLALMALGILKILKNHISFPEKIEINTDWIDILIFGGISVAYMVGSYVVSMHQLIKWIYPLEIAFSGFMLFVTLCVEKQVSKHRIGTTISALPIGVCLAISINKICAFTFVDGHQAIMEQVNYATDKLRHWEKNSARLNYIIMGTFERFNFIEKLKGETPAKIMHWFFGVVLFVYIVWFITKRLLRNDSNRLKAFQFTAVFCSIFLYSNTLCALKNYNYDLFSLAFGTIAFVHWIYAVRHKNYNYALSSFVIATLGTLEKVIVWPEMLLSMTTCIVLLKQRRNRINSFGFIETVWLAILNVGVAMGCNFYIQHIVRKDYFPNYILNNITKPLQGQMNGLIEKVPIMKDLQNSAKYALGLVFCWVAVWLISFLLSKGYSQIVSYKKYMLIILKVMSFLPLILFVAKLVCNLLWYFLSFEYMKRGVLGAFSISICTFGTVMFFLILWVLVRWEASTPHKELIAIITFCTFYLPMLYVLIDKEIVGRYLNLFGLIAVVSLLLYCLDLLGEEGIEKKIYIAIICYFVSILELMPFNPTYLYFMPIWSVENVNSGNYFGAGSERLIVGEELLKHYGEKNMIPEDVKIYINYGGDWNAIPSGWTIDTFPSAGLDSLGDVRLDDIEYGENVYYAFCAAAWKRDRYSFYPSPYDKGYIPFKEIQVMGAWAVDLYKSDDLREYFEEYVFVE